MPRKQESGTAILTCANHPSYRWIQTKYGPGYMGRGVLMFQGEAGGQPACPFNFTEAELAQTSPANQAHFRKSFTPECDCPGSDLVFLRFIKVGENVLS